MLFAHTPPCCQAGAEFSFDFLLLLLLASAIAFMGLLESSSVVLGINSLLLNNSSLYKKRGVTGVCSFPQNQQHIFFQI
jgi:hypothetical protein